jgi:hypothetical protein
LLRPGEESGKNFESQPIIRPDADAPQARQLAMAPSRRWVAADPKPPMTMNTTAMAPVMKPNTPLVP